MSSADRNRIALHVEIRDHDGPEDEGKAAAIEQYLHDMLHMYDDVEIHAVANPDPVDDSGYPRMVVDDLLRESESRFAANLHKNGPGRHWLRDEARWHIWKACDELFQARDYAHVGDYSGSLPRFADALNHIVFAMDITSEPEVESRD